MIALFDGFDIKLTRSQAAGAYHQGPCDADVKALSEVPAVRRQLAKLDPEAVRAALSRAGAWDSAELADNEQNLQRILWLAAMDITER